MKKRILAIGLLAVMMMTGCGKNDVTLGQYKGLTYTPYSTEVYDDEIQAALNVVVTQSTTYEEITERQGTPVEKGDLLSLDYTGVLDETGASFKGGTDSGLRLTIGSGKAIDGFEDALIGKTVGETCDIHLTIPENYSTDATAAGKAATLTVTINKVLKANVPELNDELISTYTNGAHTTIDSYKAYCTEYLKAQKEADGISAAKDEVLKKAIANTTFKKIDSSTIDEYYNDVYDYYKQISTYYSITVEEYAKYYYDSTLEDFQASIRTIAEETVKEQLMLDLIIEKEGLKLTDEIYNEKIQGYMDQYSYTDQAAFEKDYTVSKLKESMLYDMAIDFLYENATSAEQ